MCSIGDILKTTTEFQLIHVTKLVPYVNNARTHSPEQINKVRIYRQNPSVQAKNAEFSPHFLLCYFFA